ncbi:MAG: DUF1669 domain-containing protein [Planctomycetes bacterium]|nr:DUF1669 domain-containing protein [Planctomycetota bacterium]
MWRSIAEKRAPEALILVATLALAGVPGGDLLADEAIEVLFTSQNDPGETALADRVVASIQSAKETIVIAVAHFNFDRIAKAVVERRKEVDGLDVRVLVDFGEFGTQSSEVRRLEENDIPVRYKFYSLGYFHIKASLMHHKFMVVDGKELLTGSYNWSLTAEAANDENLLVFGAKRHPEVVKRYQDEFESLWELGRSTYPAFRRAILDEETRYLPVHFNTRYFSTPMVLTRREINPILSAARKAGLFEDEKNLESNYFDRTTKQPLDELPGSPRLIRE